MFLVWPSKQAYTKDKEQWERVIFSKYKDVNAIHHLDVTRAVITYSYRDKRTESDGIS